jgi:hypothetical protein
MDIMNEQDTKDEMIESLLRIGKGIIQTNDKLTNENILLTYENDSIMRVLKLVTTISNN